MNRLEREREKAYRMKKHMNKIRSAKSTICGLYSKKHNPKKSFSRPQTSKTNRNRNRLSAKPNTDKKHLQPACNEEFSQILKDDEKRMLTEFIMDYVYNTETEVTKSSNGQSSDEDYEEYEEYENYEEYEEYEDCEDCEKCKEEDAEELKKSDRYEDDYIVYRNSNHCEVIQGYGKVQVQPESKAPTCDKDSTSKSESIPKLKKTNQKTQKPKKQKRQTILKTQKHQTPFSKRRQDSRTTAASNRNNRYLNSDIKNNLESLIIDKFFDLSNETKENSFPSKIKKSRVKNTRRQVKGQKDYPKRIISEFTVDEEQHPERIPLYKFLKAFGLQQYAKKLVSQGYGYNLKKLAYKNEILMEEVIESVKFMPGHRIRFVEAMDELKKRIPKKTATKKGKLKKKKASKQNKNLKKRKFSKTSKTSKRGFYPKQRKKKSVKNKKVTKAANIRTQNLKEKTKQNLTSKIREMDLKNEIYESQNLNYSDTINENMNSENLYLHDEKFLVSDTSASIDEFLKEELFLQEQTRNTIFQLTPTPLEISEQDQHSDLNGPEYTYQNDSNESDTFVELESFNIKENEYQQNHGSVMKYNQIPGQTSSGQTHSMVEHQDISHTSHPNLQHLATDLSDFQPSKFLKEIDNPLKISLLPEAIFIFQDLVKNNRKHYLEVLGQFNRHRSSNLVFKFISDSIFGLFVKSFSRYQYEFKNREHSHPRSDKIIDLNNQISMLLMRSFIYNGSDLSTQTSNETSTLNNLECHRSYMLDLEREYDQQNIQEGVNDHSSNSNFQENSSSEESQSSNIDSLHMRNISQVFYDQLRKTDVYCSFNSMNNSNFQRLKQLFLAQKRIFEEDAKLFGADQNFSQESFEREIQNESEVQKSIQDSNFEYDFENIASESLLPSVSNDSSSSIMISGIIPKSSKPTTNLLLKNRHLQIKSTRNHIRNTPNDNIKEQPASAHNQFKKPSKQNPLQTIQKYEHVNDLQNHFDFEETELICSLFAFPNILKCLAHLERVLELDIEHCFALFSVNHKIVQNAKEEVDLAYLLGIFLFNILCTELLIQNRKNKNILYSFKNLAVHSEIFTSFKVH